MCTEIQRVCLINCWIYDINIIGYQHRELGKRKTIVIVAEGAHDKDLKPLRADDIKKVLSERLKLDTRVTTLGHTQRGGRPCALDRIMVSFWQVGIVRIVFSWFVIANVTSPRGSQSNFRSDTGDAVVYDRSC